MIIYIAASWKHCHAVEMLTALLRKRGHTVMSFVEMNFAEAHTPGQVFNFELWVQTSAAEKAFDYDSNAAMNSDLVIYIGPSGKDAAAELGMAYGRGVPIVGLHAKGEDFGLMRRMFVAWFSKYTELLEEVDAYAITIPYRAKL